MYDESSRVTQVHGVAVSVNETGVLILGESGTGKSAVALDLVRRGHKLIADDAVLLKLGSCGGLIAEPHTLIAGLLEVRGFGVISVSEVFGESALAAHETIEMFVEIESKIERKPAARKRMVRLFMDFNGVRIAGFTARAEKPLETASRIERKTGEPVADRFQRGTVALPGPVQVKHNKHELFLNR